MTMRIVTANRLEDGAVVYFCGAGTGADSDWTAELAKASISTTEEAFETALAKAERAVANQLVVGVYGAAIELEINGPVPVGQRENIRSSGPSIPFTQA